MQSENEDLCLKTVKNFKTAEYKTKRVVSLAAPTCEAALQWGRGPALPSKNQVLFDLEELSQVMPPASTAASFSPQALRPESRPLWAAGGRKMDSARLCQRGEMHLLGSKPHFKGRRT